MAGADAKDKDNITASAVTLKQRFDIVFAFSLSDPDRLSYASLRLNGASLISVSSVCHRRRMLACFAQQHHQV
ncbi:hypothetical protein, partial [Pseudescherichia sp.]|uniref:hypothetical protein n=1 Tax=Pseudescherichia sp. TaxID=2055881 RepID=UPI002897E025